LDAAEHSVREMASLRPRVLAPGHGEPMESATVTEELATFAESFAAPEHGRYVGEPARFDERDVAWLSPASPDPLPKVAAVVGTALLVGTVTVAWLEVTRRRGSGCRSHDRGSNAQANPVNAWAAARR
jgi:hypothetical protein